MRIDTTELPTTEVGTQKPAARAPSAGHGALDCPLSVVVLDDNAEVRGMLVAALRESGCAAVSALGYESVRGLLDSRPFDAAVIDLVMPSKNGLDVLKELRSMKYGADMAAVIMNVLPAGKTRDRLVQDVHDLGGAEVLDKPVTSTTLLAALRRLVPSKS